jgi:hypothetical protein
MITKKKIEIFNRYNGDIDKWARNNSNKEKLLIEDNDWYLIDSFLQDLFLVKKRLASSGFITNLQNKLIENCENEETITQLKKLIK